MPSSEKVSEIIHVHYSFIGKKKHGALELVKFFKSISGEFHNMSYRFDLKDKKMSPQLLSSTHSEIY